MRRTYVRPTGPTDAKLAIVGEQPGKHEIFKGIPFIGPAGQELWKILYPVGIARQEVYITNVIKDLDNHLKTYIDLSPRSGPVVSEQGWEYIKELGNELKSIAPNAVLALGNIALFALCSRTGITKWAGSVIESTLVPGLKVIPTFHPATVIAPKFQYLNRHLIRFDARRALHESQTPHFTNRPLTILTKPTFSEAIAYLKRCYDEGLKGRIIEWDIEVVNEELNCFSIAYKPDEAMCIPFVENGDYFTISQEYEILLALSSILSDPRIAYGGANNIFDCQFMFHKYGIRPRGEHHCTQIAQKITWPDFNAGLDFVTRMHTDIPYYKADGKKWMRVGGSWAEWWNYSAMDSIATASARGPQIEELQLQENLPTYNRQRALVYPLLYMMERGIRVDVEGMKREQEKEKLELEKLQERLNELAGYDLNPNSPKQLIDYFYDRKGIKPYKKRSSTGAFTPTTDVDALKRLAKPTSTRPGFEEAQIILKMRGLQKRISTYLSLDKLNADGRYRSQYKPAGTETGRLASGETIFGTGGNQQNFPHDILQFFIADDGYLIFSIDLSQIENRIVAYVGNVVPMIRAFESGVDVHSLTTAMIFDKPIEQVSDEDGSCSLGDGSQSERYWGKKANHGLNYDLGYKNFALRYEITEREAKWIVEKYHQSYPGVRQNYHAMIQSQLKEDRTITNLFGRRRIFMGPVAPDYPNVSKGHCHNTFKEAYAHLPQSTTADKINEHGVNFIYYNQQWFEPVELLTQIHDSVVFQVPISIGWLRMAEIVKRVKDSLEQPLSWRGREFSVPADTSIGLNMFKKHMIEIKSRNFPTNIYDLAKKLEEIYSSLTR